MGVNKSQSKVRQAFKNCTICFGIQPQTGGAEPPDSGARSREWWYANSSEPWYYNSFIKESMAYYLNDNTPPWCIMQEDQGNGGGSIEKGSDGESVIDDGYELPTGYTDNMLQWTDSTSTSYLSFNLNNMPLTIIKQFTFARVFVSIGYGTATDHTIYFREFFNSGNPAPIHIGQIPTGGTILDSFSYNAGGGAVGFDVKNYMVRAKESGETSLYIAINTNVDYGTGSANYSKIHGNMYTAAPATLILSI